MMADRAVGETAGRVVVGVDDSEGSRAALRVAAKETALRGAELHVVHAWTFPGGHTGHAVVDGPLRDSVIEDAHALLAQMTQEVLGGDTSCVLAVGNPPAARAIVEASQNADLVVVGCRGRGGFVGLLLGSVSGQVVHHAHCPVLVVRPTAGLAGGAPVKTDGASGPNREVRQ